MCSLLALLTSCQSSPTPIVPTAVDTIKEISSTAAIKQTLIKKGSKIFDYVDEKSGDTILMQQCYIDFLKTGVNRSQSKKELDSLQQLHLAHLGTMHQLSYADILVPSVTMGIYEV